MPRLSISEASALKYDPVSLCSKLNFSLIARAVDDLPAAAPPSIATIIKGRVLKRSKGYDLSESSNSKK